MCTLPVVQLTQGGGAMVAGLDCCVADVDESCTRGRVFLPVDGTSFSLSCQYLDSLRIAQFRLGLA